MGFCEKELSVEAGVFKEALRKRLRCVSKWEIFEHMFRDRVGILKKGTEVVMSTVFLRETKLAE